VVIDFTWKLSEMKLVGAASFQNTKSTVVNPVDYEPKCLPPVLKGEYEHYEILSINEGLGGSLEFQVQTRHPWWKSRSFCTASRKAVPAKDRDARGAVRSRLAGELWHAAARLR
jgi:hypothetical protein